MLHGGDGRRKVMGDIRGIQQGSVVVVEGLVCIDELRIDNPSHLYSLAGKDVQRFLEIGNVFRIEQT